MTTEIRAEVDEYGRGEVVIERGGQDISPGRYAGRLAVGDSVSVMVGQDTWAPGRVVEVGTRIHTGLASVGAANYVYVTVDVE